MILKLGGISISTGELKALQQSAATQAELGYIHGVTPGTVSASQALVVDASKNLTGLGSVTFAAGSVITTDSGTAAATAGAATLNKQSGSITSEALTTAAGSDYVLTLTNSVVAATDRVLVSVDNGTNTTEGLAVNRVTPGAGTCTIHVRNTHASAALNGTIVVNFLAVG